MPAVFRKIKFTMPNSRLSFIRGLVSFAPTLFVLLLALVFNDFTPEIAIIVLAGTAVSGAFFYRGRQLRLLETARDNPSRRRGRPSARAAGH